MIIFNNYYIVFLRSRSCAKSKSINEGITPIKAGISESFKQILNAVPGSRINQQVVSSLVSPFNLPSL